MSNADDAMDKPVTRRELQEILGEAFGSFLTMLDKRFDALPTKDWVNATIAASESRMKTWFGAELARHTGSVDERHRTEVSVIDDKYKDLPDRVTKLEAAVFPTPPAKRQRRR